VAVNVHAPLVAPVTKLLTTTELPLFAARVIVTDKEPLLVVPVDDPLSEFFAWSLVLESLGEDGV
jgi:hypothetical protein